MKLRVRRIVFNVGILAVAVGICFFFWQQGFFSKDGQQDSLFIETGAAEFVNFTQDGTVFITEQDPQVILHGLNRYVEELRLDGFVWQEEVQIFYSDGTAGFSEENSIWIKPTADGDSSRIRLEQTVGSLRLDFTELPGQRVTLTGLTINPAPPPSFPWKQLLLSILIAEMAAICIPILYSLFSQRKAYLGTLKKYHYLLEDLVVKDIKLKYRRSVIGILWSILSPLLMMVVITAVFQHIFRFTIENFAVYYLTGWLIFNFVTEATTGAMTSILTSGALIRKVYIPKYIFPLQKCLFAFVNLMFSLVALVIVMLALQVHVTWKILLIPIPLFYAFLFSVGVGLILAAVTVFFRDVTHLYTVFTMAWMYLTPVIYPMDALPGMMQQVIQFNPMYYYVEYFRKLVLYGELPGIRENIVSLCCAVISLLLGIAVFKKKQDRFILFI